MRSYVVIALVCTAFLAGCANKDRISELEARLDEARDQVRDINSRMSDLEAAISSLRDEVDDFAREDWRSNVPDVESATEEIESAFCCLQSQVSRLKRAL